MRVLAVLFLIGCASDEPPMSSSSDVSSEHAALSSDSVVDSDSDSDTDSDEAFIEALEALVDDLWYTSETDSLVRVVVVEGAGEPFPTRSSIRGVVAPVHVQEEGATELSERFVAEWTAERFFDGLTQEQSWWDDAQREEGERWQLVADAMFDKLEPLTVFRLGEHESSSGDEVEGVIDVYVVGASASGDLIGLHMLSVET